MKNGPNWVENGRQDLRIGPQASHSHFQASGTGPAAQNPSKSAGPFRGIRLWKQGLVSYHMSVVYCFAYLQVSCSVALQICCLQVS